MRLNKENILIVDDDLHILELLQRHLHRWNYHTYRAVSVKEAVNILRDSQVDLLITDLKMPQIDGFELIKFVSEHYPDLPKLIVTGFPSVQDSLKAIKSGVAEYLTKPFTRDELEEAVTKALSASRAKPKTPSQPVQRDAYGEIIGSSEEMNEVLEVIDRVKDNKATLYISGESGTGKELVARAVHYQGKFAAAPFVPVNCGGIPETLLEAELFGYKKGAFTGAEKDRKGAFQSAQGGTIFLDEIGNASLAVQARLLRVLQEKEVTPLGSHKPEKIDVRVIAATNNDLAEMIRKETFREDLYYRLSVVEIHIPPLRKRMTDLPLLVDKFLLKYGLEYKDRYLKIEPDALEVLKRYSWPGNIRELENVVQRAVIMCDKSIQVKDLPDHLKYAIDMPEDALTSLAEMERKYIKKVLRATGNNKTKAAEILQITRKTLREKLKE
ncbi:MAG: sigma-54-dependent Fis family transcriptional regulator [Leeuwenhoekiella sp.]|nr:MAG: sigma-54-dependent Fis family transcriptional regulator [Leeuwenhoekiella sp.]